MEPRQPVPADVVQSAELPRGLAAVQTAGERFGALAKFDSSFSFHAVQRWRAIN